MFIHSVDVNPETLKEIRETMNQHGDGCVTFLENKFDVLILGDKRSIEVYQLPEGEI
jgi:hypothetical protein